LGMMMARRNCKQKSRKSHDMLRWHSSGAIKKPLEWRGGRGAIDFARLCARWWGWSWCGGWTNRKVLRERERREGAYESRRLGQHSRHHRTIPGRGYIRSNSAPEATREVCTRGLNYSLLENIRHAAKCPSLPTSRRIRPRRRMLMAWRGSEERHSPASNRVRVVREQLGGIRGHDSQLACWRGNPSDGTRGEIPPYVQPDESRAARHGSVPDVKVEIVGRCDCDRVCRHFSTIQ
jgi:hypothetical protein